MRDLPRISEAEWQVMRILWDAAPLTAQEVIERLDPGVSWSPRTVKTLLNRLVKKGALGFEKHGRVYSYTPRVREEACVRAESRSFLRRVYGGALKPILAAFIEEESLSPEDIADLKRLLDEKERGKHPWNP